MAGGAAALIGLALVLYGRAAGQRVRRYAGHAGGPRSVAAGGTIGTVPDGRRPGAPVTRAPAAGSPGVPRPVRPAGAPDRDRLRRALDRRGR
ncbi:hypothetical protein ABTZ58_13190 [Streptomyces sp. NPDC094143]|uniref:hypothetical protein n=1 Tax=Streptomyces sp. NPDC094143 TaxID=3155310 RepID=UPI00331FA80C